MSKRLLPKPILLFDLNKLTKEANFSVALLTEEPRRRLKIPYIVIPQKEQRRYYNFKELKPEFMQNLLNNIHSSNTFLASYHDFAYKILDYYHKRCRYLFRPATVSDIYLNAYSFISYKYFAYSICCAILTTLFFAESGIPSNLSIDISLMHLKKALKDVFDVLFFPIAFYYTTKLIADEYTLELIITDPVYIARDFLSFILYKETYPYLFYSYRYIVNFGIDPEKIWITL